MKKIKWSSILLTMCALAVVIGIASLTVRGKKTKEKLVLGDWYRQWSESLSFTLYDDGTANIAGTDRMGKWSLVNDDQLILTDADGKATILKIEGIDADNMEVRERESGHVLAHRRRSTDNSGKRLLLRRRCFRLEPAVTV